MPRGNSRTFPSPEIPLGMEMFDILAHGSPQGARQKTITLDKHSSFTDLTQRSA